MADYLRVGRLYFVLLAIFAGARFAQGAMGVSYEKAHHVFSIVILTMMASAFYAVFCRRWRGYGLFQAMSLGALFGFIAEVVIFVATMFSYGLGIDTFFTHQTALNQTSAVPMAQALVIRAQAFVTFPIINAIAAAIGWALGGLLPDTAATGAASATPPPATTVVV